MEGHVKLNRDTHTHTHTHTYNQIKVGDSLKDGGCLEIAAMRTAPGAVDTPGKVGADNPVGGSRPITDRWPPFGRRLAAMKGRRGPCNSSAVGGRRSWEEQGPGPTFNATPRR